jgi:trimethylamine--corrinoid protein Co-methyltransferase
MVTVTRKKTRKHRRKQSKTAAKPSVVQPGLLGGQYKPLKLLDIQRISEASFELLERAGIEVHPSECRDIFQRAGARIDASRNRVFIPRGMVEDALAVAQNEIFLAGRDPKHDMILGGNETRHWQTWVRLVNWWMRWTTFISICGLAWHGISHRNIWT